VYDFQRDEFIVGAIDPRNEEEGGVAAVYYFCVCGRCEKVKRGKGGGLLTFIFEEITHFCPSGQDQLYYVFYGLGFIFGTEGCEPFC